MPHRDGIAALHLNGHRTAVVLVYLPAGRAVVLQQLGALDTVHSGAVTTTKPHRRPAFQLVQEHGAIGVALEACVVSGPVAQQG